MLLRGETLPALRTLHPFKVDPPDFIRRNRAPTLRLDGLDGRHNLFKIDFLLPGHVGDCLTRALFAEF